MRKKQRLFLTCTLFKLSFLYEKLFLYSFLALSVLLTVQASAQIQPGCVNANFGVDADINANQFQFGGFSSPNGKDDWFKSASYGGTGLGVLDTTGAAALYNFFNTPGNLNKMFTRRSNSVFFERANNTIQVDALFAKDYTGSSGGYQDSTAFATGSKNAMDPVDWDATVMPVQGKNDILDVYGHLRRAGTTNTSPLWLFMGASMADPNGTRYMDFEFFQKSLTFNSATKFTSAGTQEGHTAFAFDNTTGKITQTGDLIFSMAITGGAPSDFEIRIWVSKAIYNSTFNPTDFDFDRTGAYFDGASNSSTYGYARIIPKGTAMLQACGIVNTAPTPAGPWGTLNSNGDYTTDYSMYQFAEFGFNLSSFGIDPLIVKPGASVCTAAFASYVVKTRASASFTAALKDFGGPYVFGGPQNIAASITGSNILTCDAPSATLTATTSPASSVTYFSWTAPDGTKQAGTGLTSITATQTGIYTLEISPVEGCSVMGASTFNLIEDNVPPPAPTNPQGASYCAGGSPQAISVANPGIGYQIRWYNTETGGTVLATGTSFTPTAAGTYYAETRNMTNGCACVRIPVTLTEVADPSVSVNVSEGMICTNGSTVLTATVSYGTGTTNYQWQSSLDNIAFTNLSGETNAVLNISNLNTTTYYKVVVSQSGSGCGSASSFSTKITVNPTCNPCNCQRQLLYNTDFESGTANGWTTGIVGQAETASVYIYTGGPTGRYAALNYTDLYSATGDYYIEQKWNSIIAGRTYIFSGDLARHAGTRAFIRAEFYNASNQLLSQTPDQYATTQYPTFIPFSFNLVAPPGASYIRIVGFANRTALKMDNVKLVTCFEPVISFVNLMDANTCSGGSVGFNAKLSDPSVPVNYQWQFSPNGTTWTNVSGATNATFTVSPTVNTFYRVNATPTNGSCSTTSSYPLKVTIHADPTVAVAVSNASICTGSSTTLTATVTNGTGTTNYQWQSSTDNVAFNNISGATSATLNTGALSANQYYKVIVNKSGNGCSTATSAVTTIAVATPSVKINSIGSKICVGRSAMLTTTVTPSQNVVGYQWQISTDNTTWSNISNATNSSFDVPTASASDNYYRVIVSMNGGCGLLTANSEHIIVGNFPGCDCIVQSCSAYTKLVYKNPILISDVTGLVGDKWRFNNVATGFDAIVEITKAVNANSLNAIDNTAVNVDDWCPEINFNFLAGQDSYLDWKITIVATGTETPANLPTSSRVSSYDVDGNSNYREMHGHINSNGFIVNDPTELSIVKEAPFTLVLGSTNEYASISTDPKVKATFYYPGQNNVFTIRLGVRTTNAVSAGFRQFAVSFDPCISYTNPDINPQKPEIIGAVETCVDGTNQTYSTTQPFTSYNWTVAGGTIVSGQGTQSILVDWASIANHTISLTTIDANGCTSTVAYSVNVVNNPAVTVTANNAEICSGGASTLTATVINGSGSTTYQWQSSSDDVTFTNISGETNAILNLNNLTATTYYKVIITQAGNGCGIASSTTSTKITVKAAPSVNVAASEAEICSGGASALTATVINGSGSTTYQWQSSSDDVTFSNILNEANAVLSLNNITATTYYKVIISQSGNGCGTATSTTSTKITVKPAPSVNVVVKDAEICSGGKTSLTATVINGSGSTTYQWQSSTDDGSTWNDILGATTPSYSTPPLTKTVLYKLKYSGVSSNVYTSPATATYSTVNAGNWSNGSTWAGGVAPPSTLNSGITVKINHNITISSSININGGSLYANKALISLPSSLDFFVTAGFAQFYDCIITQGNGANFKVLANGHLRMIGCTVTIGQNFELTEGKRYLKDVCLIVNENMNNSKGRDTLLNVCAQIGAYSSGNFTVQSDSYSRMENSKFDILNGNFQNSSSALLNGSGLTIRVRNGNLQNSGTWQASITKYCVSSDVSGITAQYLPQTETCGDIASSFSICNCEVDDCRNGVSNISQVKVVPAPSVNVSASNAEICSGGASTLTATVINGSGSTTYQWQSSSDDVTFSNINGETNATLNLINLTTTTYYKVIITQAGNGCGIASSTTSTKITVKPAPSVNVSASNAEICSSGATSLTATVINGSGSTTYQWQSSTDDVTFTNISGETNATLSLNNLTATSFYKVNISQAGSGCGTASSTTSTKITVKAAPSVNVAASDATICTGSAAILNATVSNGSGTTSFQWQNSIDGVSFNNINGETAASLTTPVLTQTTYYRVVVSQSGNGCGTVNSAATAVNVAALPTADADADQSQCNNVFNMAANNPSAGTGTWTIINGTATIANINSATTTVTVTSSTAILRWTVRVNATCEEFDDVLLNLAQQLLISSDPTAIDECIEGNRAMGVNISGGTGFQNYQWQISTDNITWFDVKDATNSSFFPQSLASGTTYYRVIITPVGAGCNVVTSGSARVRIFEKPTITVVANDATVCAGNGTTFSATVSNGVGTIVYQWQNSTDGINFTNIGGATNVIYNTPALTETTHYRLQITQSGSGCGTVTSTSTTITVTADPVANAGADKMQCSNVFKMTANTPSVGTGLWTVINGTATIEDAQSPTTNVTITSPTATLRWTNKVNNTCSNADEVVLSIAQPLSISAQPNDITQCVGGSLTLTAAVTGGAGTLTYQWQSSSDNTVWSDISGANDIVYTPASTTSGVVYYRLMVRSSANGCSEISTSSATVTIIDKPKVAVTAKSTTVCNGGGIQLDATINGGVDCTVQWQNSVNGGAAWNDIPDATSNTFTTSTLGQTTKYRVTLSCNGNGCCN